MTVQEFSLIESTKNADIFAFSDQQFLDLQVNVLHLNTFLSDYP